MAIKKDIRQSYYNKQHNMYQSQNGQTAYQMLIEQVVTGERTYSPIKLTNKDDKDALDEALMRIEFRDIIGYVPQGIIKRVKVGFEIPRIELPPRLPFDRTYSNNGDRDEALFRQTSGFPPKQEGLPISMIESLVDLGSQEPVRIRYSTLDNTKKI